MSRIISNIILVLLLSLPVGAAIINIPDDFETIQGGIDAAEDGDTVLVEPGEYPETINFSGKAITVGSLILTTEDPDFIAETVINGQNERVCVVFNGGERRASILRGFTITRGIQNWGGGIDCQRGSSPHLVDLHITQNTARSGGGGAHCSADSRTLFERCLIDSNFADSDGGGGVSAYGARPILRNCELIGNSTQGRHGGGAVVLHGGGLRVEGCLIEGNSHEGDIGGCAIHGYGIDSLVLQQTIIKSNQGLDSHRGTLLIYTQEEVFSYIEFDHLAIIDNACRDCLIYGNASRTVIRNLTLAGNRIENNDPSFYFTSITDISNSVFWDEGVNSYLSGSLTIDYSLVRGSRNGFRNRNINWGDNNIEADPLFADPENGNYHLTRNSPCIDAGDPEAPPDPDSTRADMGAFYFHQGLILDVPEDFETIQAAINAAEDGDTILVQPGTYRESLSIGPGTLTIGSLYLTTGDESYIPRTVINGDSGHCVVDLCWCDRARRDQDWEINFSGLTIQGGGPGFVGWGATFDLDHCIVQDNFCGAGGGIHLGHENHLRMINCLFKSNAADLGAAIFCEEPNPLVAALNCTFIGNQAQESGSIFCGGGEPLFLNCIIWANEGEPINAESALVRFSDIQGGWAGEGNIEADPWFTNPDNADFTLSPNSPCIDRGTPLFVWEDDTLLNLTPDDYQSNAPDMGAYESPFVNAAPGVVLQPLLFNLSSFPNPFNSMLTMSYSLPFPSPVSLKVFDLSGREVATLAEGWMEAGAQRMVWNAGALPSGLYSAALQTPYGAYSVRLVLNK